MGEDLGFHTSLPRRIWRRLSAGKNPVLAMSLVAALGIWQVANAVGFTVEGLVSPRRTAAPREGMRV